MSENSDWRKIIGNSCHLSEEDKGLFTAIFEGLQKQQENIFSKIEANVKADILHKRLDNWNIATVLIDKTDDKKFFQNGFTEIVSIDVHREQMKYEELEETKGNIYCAGIGFLNCRYHEIRGYINKIYSAKVTTKDSEYQVSYRLYPTTVFFEKEEKAEKTALQYGIKVPAIYSPMSRRAVLVKVEFNNYKISKSDQLQIDFQYKNNGLDHILLSGKTLVWNISVSEKNQIPKENTKKSITPAFAKTYQIYEFDTKINEYIYIESSGADLKRFGDTIYLGLSENHSINDLRYWRIQLNSYSLDYLKDTDFSFRNEFISKDNFKERIRTEADIQYIMNCFDKKYFKYKGCQNKEGRRSIEVYDKRNSYHYPKDKHLTSSSFCYVVIEETENIYFEDLVSYVMAYMNYFYPEFYWVGVV